MRHGDDLGDHRKGDVAGTPATDVESGGRVQMLQRRRLDRAGEPGEQVGGATPAAQNRHIPGGTAQGSPKQHFGVRGVVVDEHHGVVLVELMSGEPVRR